MLMHEQDRRQRGRGNDSPLVALLREANRNLLCAALTARDSLQQAKGELENQDRFFAILAHELRSPITPIKLAARALGAPNAAPARHPQLSQTLLRQLDYLNQMVNTLDDVARIRSGKMQLDMRLLCPADALNMALEMVRPLIEVRQQQLTLDLPAQPVLVRGDHDRLVQVFANLLSNAVKFTPAHGTIAVSAGADGGAFRCTISDSGSGIAPSFQPFMFDLYAQGGATQPHSRAGSGIGLSLVRRLVELHGGRVEIASGAPGTGCRATVSLPLAPD